mgnify:FL=1
MKTFKELRQRLSASRDHLIQDQEVNASLTQNFKAALSSVSGQCLGIYWPIKSEFNALAIATQWAYDNKKTLALPITKTNQALEFGRLAENTPMQYGPHKIPEPVINDASDLVVPDVIVIPCLGWQSKNGQLWRIGYGGGYYDRTIKSLKDRKKNFVTWGICYKALEVESSAWEPQTHDQPLDKIITD